jgi:hypothetical protein
MPRSGDRKPARRTFAALVVALLFHAGLLMLPLPLPQTEHRDDGPAALTVELVARTAETTATSVSARPEPELPDPPEPHLPESPAKARPESDPQSVVEKGETRVTRPGSVQATGINVTEQNAASAEHLRARLLEEAGAIGRRLEQGESEPTLEYARVPDLPGRAGWLQRYTGRVAPSIDRWRAGDGSRSARLVTGSGQVICVRTRAPTIDEIFNPWQSSAVPMMRDCGRERPTLDAGDPWLRRPGQMPGEE